MEPKPVITYHGDTELLGPVLQKKLQTRLKQLQLTSLSKDEGPAFSSLCSGVTFAPLSTDKKPRPPYERPALHTYWTSCIQYRTHEQKTMEQWLDKVKGGDVGTLIVYVVTAEVRTRRTRTLTGKPVEERIKNDFRGRADEVITFRLSDNDATRLSESYSTFTSTLNQMCLDCFNKIIEREEELVARQQPIPPDKFYQDVFVRKLDLAVCFEMTLQNLSAQLMYYEAITDLESALTEYAATPPSWLRGLCHAPCTSWDYPKLVWSQLSWQYLAGVRSCSSPLLHVRTFFLSRLSHLLFTLGRAWSVSELVISTLHCMAREITTLQLCFPEGAFDCWAYMSCNEAIQAFMALISPDSLQSATSSLLLVRAQLWHYALEKLEAIGGLCGVMPSANKLNQDSVLIKQLTSGIHPVPLDFVPTDVSGIEDQGKCLLDTLNDRLTFQTEFLRLGEMVIGAFKYAGRRRMAFSVGTTIAQFQKELGLVNEAEELLSDICKFYSEDQWTQLSTNAFALSAGCQLKLKMEDKYVNTMLLLVSLPPHPGESHDPSKWLSSLASIAHRSPYQKLLNWEPLLSLVGVVIEGGRSFTIGDTVIMEIRLSYNGPKELVKLIATAELRGGGTPHTSSTPSSPARPHTSPPSTPTLLANLDDLDLFNSDGMRGSRPIGGEGKYRASTSLVTHISSAEIAELVEEDGGRGKHPDMLRAMGVVIHPGDNRILLSGKVSHCGDCSPHKLSLKWGCLDFVHTLSHAPQLSVHPLTVNLDLWLLSECGVFLEGATHDCHLVVKVGEDTTIPENAQIRLDLSNGISSSDQLLFTLPGMCAGESHDCHMTLSVDSNSSHDPPPSNELTTWTHEATAYCDWLTPTHVAVMPVRVYRPLTLRVSEHCGGQRSFLRVEVVNSCPLPLRLRDVRLSSPPSLDLTPLHTQPELLYPRESYSLLWAVGTATPTLGSVNDVTISLDYLPCIHDDQQPLDYRTFNYNFQVSDMTPVFELRAFVDSNHEAPLRVKGPATLSYHLKNTTITRTQLPAQLHYQVAPSAGWELYADSVGVLDVPGANETVVVTVSVVPKGAGLLSLPSLVLKVGGVTIGGAQVYNLSQGQMVPVNKGLY
ncbi:trafficking protein particle complex subunit 10-like [Halichondria panicea]|uniref:trafficking protein particle complex subunit 10-like n=1 Tax=Halichondria panicea TaxID=6063 RepID=UPI00312B8BEE